MKHYVKGDGIRRRLENGDATIVGVGQGRQTVREARPKQAVAFGILSRGGQASGRRFDTTVDSEGERGVVVASKLKPEDAARLGRRFGQRSVMNGLVELDSETAAPLARYRVGSVGPTPPEGFFTFVEGEGLYYQLVPVTAHLRSGRPVVGYASRRRVQRGGRT